jgi:beta-galactosidase
VLLLSGRGDCLQIDAADLGLEGEFFTLEAWVKPDQLTGSSSLVGKTESSEFGLFLEGGKPQLMVHLQGDYVRAISADVEVHPGRWQHVAGTYDGKHLRVFVDGRKVAEAAASGARKRNSLPLFVGAEPQGDRSPTGFLQGAVDEVRISKVVRYRGKFTPQRRLQSDSRTLALFRLDRNLGPFVLDHSARAQHAQRLGRAICVFADSE